MNPEELANALGGATLKGGKWYAACPCHNDTDPSLCIEVKNGKLVLVCRAGCDQETLWPAVHPYLNDGNGTGKAPKPAGKPKKDQVPPPWERPVERVYRYPEGEKVRFADGLPQKFQKRKGPDDWKAPGVPFSLYRLADIQQRIEDGASILLCEGERDADTAAGHDFFSVSGPDGPAWKPQHTESLRGAYVVIVPDVDAAGLKQGHAKAAALQGVASTVLWLELPGLDGLPGRKDLTDWFANGGTPDQLDNLMADAPEWERPDDDPPEQGPEQTEPEGERVVDAKDPLPTARDIFTSCYRQQGARTLAFHNGEWLTWAATHWRAVADAELRGGVYEWLDGAQIVDGKGNLQRFKPTRSKVADVLDALQGVAALPADVEAPAWLDDLKRDATQIVPCANGLLHLPTGTLQRHSPLFLNRWALPYEYDPAAPEPVELLTFLHALWGDDQDSIDTLQEMFGYTLTPDSSQEKLFMLVGPRRSGKGTLGRVLRATLGPETTCAPTLSSLGQSFGMEPLIGRHCAIVADARLGGKADMSSIAERLLSISGEDAQQVPRKYRGDWHGHLPVRFIIMTNELPRLDDASGALASRFIVLTLTESFYGKEDHGLTARLLRELPGILNWSIDGWKRLQARGHFIQPTAGAQAVQALEDLSSPIGAFIRDRCVVAFDAAAPRDRLYSAWRSWCESNGRPPGSMQRFGRDLRAAVPSLGDQQTTDDLGMRIRAYLGVGLAN